MYESSNPFLKSEIEYRADRLRSGLGPRKSRQLRLPRVRRTTSPGSVR